MTAHRPATVLVVEDDPGIAELERARLEEAGYRVLSAPTAGDALAHVRRGGVDLMLLDYRLPGGPDGIDLYDRIRGEGFDLPVILVTGFSDEATAIRALRAGVRDFVTKSVEYLDYLPEAVGRVLDQARTEQRLAESEARLSSVIASAKDAIIVTEADRRVSLFNTAAERMFLCPAAEALGQPITRFIPDELTPPDDGPDGRPDGAFTLRLRTGTRGVRAGGEEFPLEASVSRVVVAGRRFHTVVVRDVTERRRDEERIREQAALLDEARDAIIVRGLDDVIRYWNRGAERLYGWTAAEVVGRTGAGLLDRAPTPESEEAQRAVLEAGEWAGELREVTKDGREVVVDSRRSLLRDDGGRPKAQLVINTDLTEKKRLEAQFLRAQRLESLGTLAGGIAHDLNNVLTPIGMAVDFLGMPLPDGQRQAILATLRAATDRGTAMVRQVLSFARGIDGQRAPVRPGDVVVELEQMVRQTFPKGIEVRVELPPDPWPVVGDATQLYQVAMNLCVNARDAMPRGGRLTVGAENVHLDGASTGRAAAAKPGPYVRLWVADTGTGIPADVLGKIFDPFFTTKAPGAGTGLGLATVLGIVNSHGGFVDVESEVGRGSCFSAYFPAAQSAAGADRSAPAPPPAGHGELILLIDDEDSIRQIATATLEANGYRVLSAGDGLAAAAVFERHRAEVRAVVCDRMMPAMDGPATVPVIATSGTADDPEFAGGVQAVLRKPYTQAELLTALDRVIRSPGPTRPPPLDSRQKEFSCERP